MNAKRTEVENILNNLGTSSSNISEQIREACQLAGDFAKDITTRAAGQALHDQLTNLPTGIYSRHEYQPRIAFLNALAGSCGKAVIWDIREALELCADILDDVNAHGEAAAVREMLNKL